MKIDTLRTASSNALGVAMLLLVGAFVYAMFIERSYLTYEGVPFVVIGGPFHPNDTVPMVLTRCNADDKAHSYQLSHLLVPIGLENYTPLPPAFVHIPPGCKQSISRVNVLPRDTAPGRYRLRGGAQTVGILRTFDISWETEEFEVVK